jgi:hypothetical protein
LLVRSAISVVVAALLGGVAPPAGGETVALDAARDNTLYENPFGTTSNGAGSYLFAGMTDAGLIRRGLIGFDVAAAIPPHSIIESVTLRLHMSRTNTAGEVVSLHRVLADWGEGSSVGLGEEGNGGPAAAGDATWLHTYYDAAFWGSPGGDFDAAASGAAVVFGNGHYLWGSTPEMVSDVQAWLDDPATNFGWLLVGNEFASTTAKRFDSRQHPDPLRRPVLEIQYRAVPEPWPGWLVTMWLVGRGSRRQ